MSKPLGVYYVGLDLGQAQDYTALAVIERQEAFPLGRIPDPEITRQEGHYTVAYLKRWPLGTPYPTIVKEVASYLDRLPRDREHPAEPQLVVDATGVGRAVVDLFRQAELRGRLMPMTITGGLAYSWQSDGWHVAKKHLAGTVQVLFQQQRLKILKMPDRDTLIKELRSFRVKVSTATGNETFEAWREKDHDDLVLAVAMPCWLAERGVGNQKVRVRFHPYASEKKEQFFLRIIVCTHEELSHLACDHRAILVSITDPSPATPVMPAHGLRLLDQPLQLSFANLDPAQHRGPWTEPVAPYGLPIEQVVMNRDQGKKLWSYLTRKRTLHPEIYVLADSGDGRALSLGYAICDLTRLPRERTLFQMGKEWKATPEDVIPNRHIYDLVRTARGLVVG